MGMTMGIKLTHEEIGPSIAGESAEFKFFICSASERGNTPRISNARATPSPRLKAIVAALRDDFAVAEFEKRRETAAHRRAGAERAAGNFQFAGPDEFDGDATSFGHDR